MPTHWLGVRSWQLHIPGQIDHGEDDERTLRAIFGPLRPELGVSTHPTSVNDFFVEVCAHDNVRPPPTSMAPVAMRGPPLDEWANVPTSKRSHRENSW